MRSAVVIMVMLLGGAAAGETTFDRVRAQALLTEGNQAMGQGLYLDALAKFEEAFAAYPSPKIHFNIAQACNELGRLLDALDHYERYVRDVTRDEQPKLWQLAQERIFKLQGRIAMLEVRANVVDAVVTADGQVIGKTPLGRAMRFMPGSHAVVLSKEGYAKQVIELTMRAGELISRRVVLQTEDEAAAKRKVVLDAEAQARAAQQRLRSALEEAEHKRHRTRLIVRRSGWAALGVGFAAVVTGAACGALFRREASRIEDAPAGTPWGDLRASYDRSGSYRTGFYAATVTGIALMLGGGILVGWSYRPEETLAKRLTLAPQGAGLQLAGRF